MENLSFEPQRPQRAQRIFGSTFFAALAAFAVIVTSVRAAQPDRSRTESLARRAGERLSALQREADHLATEERSLLTDLRKLEVERQIRQEEFAQADAELAKVQTDIDATSQRIDALQASEAAARPELQSRLIEMYKLGKARYARVLLSTPDLRRIGQASRTVAALAKLDRDRIAQHQRMVEELRSNRATLEERQRQASG